MKSDSLLTRALVAMSGKPSTTKHKDERQSGERHRREESERVGGTKRKYLALR